MPDAKTPLYRWVVLGTWITAHVLAFSIQSVLGVLLPSISQGLALSPAEQGLLGSSAQWGTMVLAIPFAIWGSRYSPKMLTSVTLFAGAGLVFVQGWAPTFLVLLVGRILFGITIIGRRASFALLVQQWFRSEEVVLANGVVNLVFGLMMGLGYIATPLLLDAMGGSWRHTLYVLGGASAATAVLWSVLGRERSTADYNRRALSQERSPLWSVVKYRELWVCGMGFMAAQLAWMAFATFWPTLMLNRYGLPLRWSGGILALNSVMAAVGGITVGMLASRPIVGRLFLVLAGGLLSASLASMSLTGSIPTLVVLDLVNGVSWAFWPLLMALPFGLPDIKPREVAVALALFDTCLMAGGALGPIVAGFVQEATGEISVALVITSLFCLGISLVGLWAPLRARALASGTDAPR